MSSLRTAKLDLRVSKAQKDLIASKANEYGVTMTDLVIAAVEAYAMTCDKFGDEQVVAVSYGALKELSVYFSQVLGQLKAIAANVVAARDYDSCGQFDEAFDAYDTILGQITEAVSELRSINATLTTISEKSLVKVFSLPFERAGWTVAVPNKGRR